MKAKLPVKQFVQCIVMLLTSLMTIQAQQQLTIACDQSIPQLQFAAHEITDALPDGLYTSNITTLEKLGHSGEGITIILGSCLK